MIASAAALRPYLSLFVSRFQLIFQYRGAAFAGFVTQCWWGGLKVMILAAFYGASSAGATAPITLAQAITYSWVAQGLLAMLPWLGDPDIATSVRTGSVSYDRVRPLDFYSMWYARAAGWMAARTVPRVFLMFLFAAILLPLVGLGEWGWGPPVGLAASVLFTLSVGLALLLSSAVVMLVNVGVAASLNARGINALINAPVVVFSGNLLPLTLFPEGLQTVLLLQPFAGLLDIPLRIYFGQLEGVAALGGLALQVFWIAALVLLGRWWMSRVLRTLEMQGG